MSDDAIRSGRATWRTAVVPVSFEVPSWLRIDDEVRARIARLRQPLDRATHHAARALVVLAASTLLDKHPSALVLEQQCTECGLRSHGRPSIVGFPQVFVSWSHSQRFAAAAASLSPVSVDIEATTADVIPDGVLTPREQAWSAGQPDRRTAFLRLWTRKECLAKLGLAPLDRFSNTDVLVADSPATRLAGLDVTERVRPGVVVSVLHSGPLPHHGSSASFSE